MILNESELRIKELEHAEPKTSDCDDLSNVYGPDLGPRLGRIRRYRSIRLTGRYCTGTPATVYLGIGCDTELHRILRRSL